MSPKIFIASLQSIFSKLKWQEKVFGVKIGGSYLNNLRFADDIVLAAKTPQELRAMITELHDGSDKVELRMNKSKTKLIFINTLPANINISNEHLEMVHNYVYLSQLIHADGSQQREMKRVSREGFQILGNWANKYLQDKSSL